MKGRVAHPRVPGHMGPPAARIVPQEEVVNATQALFSVETYVRRCTLEAELQPGTVPRARPLGVQAQPDAIRLEISSHPGVAGHEAACAQPLPLILDERHRQSSENVCCLRLVDF